MDFIYYRLGLETSKIEQRDSLEPGTKIFLDQMNLEALSAIKGWQIQGILSKPEQEFVSPIINQFISFQTKKFASSGAYGENDFLHEPAIVIPLLSDDSKLLVESLESLDFNKIVKQKESENIQLNTAKIFQSARPDRPPREIDLHITDDWFLLYLLSNFWL